MTSKIEKFKVEAESNLWKGLARQEHRFHVPQGELIDNSLSAELKKKLEKVKNLFLLK